MFIDMRTVEKVTFLLVVIGALNWGLTAFNANLVEATNNQVSKIVGKNLGLNVIIYILVGISAAIQAYIRYYPRSY